MKKFIKKIFQITLGNILNKIYIYYIKTHNYIPSFLRTPRIINCYIQNRFTYKSDLENFGVVDFKDSAINILKRESDDCDGYSQVAKDLLLPKYKAEMYIVTVLKVDTNGAKEFKAHQTCLFVNKDYTYSSIDNMGLSYPITFYRITDAGKYLTKKVYGDEYQVLKISKI